MLRWVWAALVLRGGVCDVWPASTLGNHRYRFTVPETTASAVLVELPWRRTGSDGNISDGAVAVLAGAEAVRGLESALRNATVVRASRTSGLVAVDARGLEAGAVLSAYYMPFRRTGGVYGMDVTYLKASDLAAPDASRSWRPLRRCRTRPT